MKRRCEWDPEKARSNVASHGIGFTEAETVLDDPWILERLDEKHSALEERWRALGRTAFGRLVVVIYAERGDRTRLVTARRATRRERREYEER